MDAQVTAEAKLSFLYKQVEGVSSLVEKTLDMSQARVLQREHS